MVLDTFKAVYPDMKLEQIINCSQKSARGTEYWVLCFRMDTSVSWDSSGLIKLKIHTGPTLHSELTGRINKQLSEEINKVRDFFTERGNLYKTTRPTPLDKITSGTVVPKEHSKLWWKYFNDGKQRYKHFRDKRYIIKSTKLCDTIMKVRLHKLDDKDRK